MKKLYLLTTMAILGFVNFSQAQYTATNSGNWSNPITWAPGAVPSNPCNNCTITIAPGVTVTLDESETIQGTSQLVIGPGATITNPSKLIIPASAGTSVMTGNNIIMINSGSNAPNVVLSTPYSTIDASGAGEFDGVFINFLNIVYSKVVGNAPSVFLFGTTVANMAAPVYGNGTTGTLANGGPFSINGNGTLPIILSNFDAVLNGKIVDLTWTSAIEINSDHYAIQRSADGNSWNTIGTVQAKGFSSIAVNYAFTDVSPLNGINYYRLQMVDQNGKFGFSPIKVVRTLPVQGLSVFPNPARDYVNVTIGTNLSSNITIRLINQFGQLMQEQRVSNASGTTVSLPVGTYAQGNYYLQVIQSDGTQQTSKVLIAR
ncbi:MAG TPA: T9SS type A sorting domain-containing protein [Puia sp.]|nr:T9SS type A sorting domain-containing protein [Puia sp.]